MNKRLTLKVMLALLACTGFAQAAEPPAGWPSKPVKIVVPFPAGGSADVLARLIGQRLSDKFGQQFIVDNKAGAAGNIGTDFVAKSAPDGYTFGMMTSGPLANNKFLYKKMPYDPQKDLTPIVLVGEIPLIVVSNPSVPAKNLKELIDMARAAPGKVSVGHPGTGTIGHLAIEHMILNQKVQFLSVPYKGDTPAMADVMGGAVNAVSAPIGPFIPNVLAGKINGLAVLSKTRFAGLPNVPTAGELGLTDLEISVWFGFVGPAGTPQGIVDRLNTEINVILQSAEGRARLTQFAAVVGGGTPQRLASLMQTESGKWQRVIEAINLKLD